MYLVPNNLCGDVESSSFFFGLRNRIANIVISFCIYILFSSSWYLFINWLKCCHSLELLFSVFLFSLEGQGCREVNKNSIMYPFRFSSVIQWSNNLTKKIKASFYSPMLRCNYDEKGTTLYSSI